MFEKKMAGDLLLEKGRDKDMKRLEAEPERISLGEQEHRQGQGGSQAGAGEEWWETDRVEVREGGEQTGSWADMNEGGKQAGLDERQGEGEADRVEGKHNRIQPHKVGDRVITSIPFYLAVQNPPGLSLSPFQKLVKKSEE